MGFGSNMPANPNGSGVRGHPNLSAALRFDANHAIRKPRASTAPAGMPAHHHQSGPRGRLYGAQASPRSFGREGARR